MGNTATEKKKRRMKRKRERERLQKRDGYTMDNIPRCDGCGKEWSYTILEPALPNGWICPECIALNVSWMEVMQSETR